MRQFAAVRDTQMQHISLLQPSTNPSETFFRLLDEALKIVIFVKSLIKTVLKQLLANYCDVPHAAIGFSPASMSFRDGQEKTVSKVTASDDAINDEEFEVYKSKFFKVQ